MGCWHCIMAIYQIGETSACIGLRTNEMEAAVSPTCAGALEALNDIFFFSSLCIVVLAVDRGGQS